MSDTTVAIDILDGPTAAAHVQDLVDLYRRVYAEKPYYAGDDNAVADFVERTGRQVLRPNFRLVRARVGEQLVGFAFGFTFTAGGWWRGEAEAPPDEILSAEKYGVIELVVDADWRGHGLGHRLMATLLAGRPEPWAMLTAVSTAPARAIYARWGWVQVGTAHHTANQPVMDQLVLPLPWPRSESHAV